jgi:hypothetical protein
VKADIWLPTKDRNSDSRGRKEFPIDEERRID